jgi:hypothetical protein
MLDVTNSAGEDYHGISYTSRRRERPKSAVRRRTIVRDLDFGAGGQESSFDFVYDDETGDLIEDEVEDEDEVDNG